MSATRIDIVKNGKETRALNIKDSPTSPQNKFFYEERIIKCIENNFSVSSSNIIQYNMCSESFISIIDALI